MAQTNNTPVSYWLSISVRSLAAWISESNSIVSEARAAAAAAKAKVQAQRKQRKKK